MKPEKQQFTAGAMRAAEQLDAEWRLNRDPRRLVRIDEAAAVIDRETGLPELHEACKDVAQYLEAIQMAAEEIGEYTAIGEKLVTLKAALSKANGE